MKQSSILVLFTALSTTEAFAPRPGYSIRSTQRLPLSQKSILRATTLQKEIETTNSSAEKLPFYAKPDLLSASDYQQQESSLQVYQPQESSLQLPQQEENKLAEFGGVATWITALSSFLLVNNYIGPWPANLLAAIPVKAFGLTHAVAGMLFGGGIILTTLIEWLATGSKNASVLQFYFDKVPKLDAFVVLPALTASIVSGVGLAVDHYDSLANSPFHVVGAISTLLAFAIWWALTDVTTQGAAMEAIQEWTQGDTENTDVPQIVQLRKISNVVSCLFVGALYGFMVLKPGFTPPVVV